MSKKAKYNIRKSGKGYTVSTASGKVIACTNVTPKSSSTAAIVGKTHADALKRLAKR